MDPISSQTVSRKASAMTSITVHIERNRVRHSIIDVHWELISHPYRDELPRVAEGGQPTAWFAQPTTIEDC